MWLWIIWFLSQLWITLHIWYPKSSRLASTEEIFGSPYFSSAFIDQSLVLNRRRDGESDDSDSGGPPERPLLAWAVT